MLLPYKNITLDKVFKESTAPRRTKIICTIGPACDDVIMMVQLIDAGLNVARLNFSHGDHASKLETIRKLKEANRRRPEKHISILLDTKGPEIRSGMLKNKSGVMLTKGSHIEIVTDYEFLGDEKSFACSYERLPQTVIEGDTILAADGSLVMRVVKVLEKSVIVEMMNSGKLGERKNMNLPGNKVDIPTVTEQDKEDIAHFAKYVDFIAVSFVQKGSDIHLVKSILGKKPHHCKIIAKIENQEGLANFESILDNFDAVMIARGDMGMEIPLQKVFLAQKMIIRKCNLVGKPVIVATQMLESMGNNPRPTRAESTDVANAVLDGADCVMLSGETAAGHYPIESVTAMSSLCKEAESIISYATVFESLMLSIKSELISIDDARSDVSSVGKSSLMRLLPVGAISSAVATGAVKAQIESEAKLIIVASQNAESAKVVSQYKPGALVIFPTHNISVARQVSGIWSSTHAVLVPHGTHMNDKVEKCIEYAVNAKWVKEGDPIICLRQKRTKKGRIRYAMEVLDV